MSKAEDRAKERYWLEPSNIETQEKYAAYVEGYHQAEKDIIEKVKALLLSEVLPCFMHGGEADEVVAMLDEKLLKDE